MSRQNDACSGLTLRLLFTYPGVLTRVQIVIGRHNERGVDKGTDKAACKEEGRIPSGETKGWILLWYVKVTKENEKNNPNHTATNESLVTAVPSKKSSIQPGDRVLEINGVPYTDFKSEKSANDLFEKLVLDVVQADDDDSEEGGSDEDDLD